MRIFAMTVILAAMLAGAAQADDGWVVGPATGAPGRCQARLAGKQVNVTVMFNNAHSLLLTAANPNWNQWGAGEVDTVIAVDGANPIHIAASPLGPLVLTPVEEPLATQLRTAKMLDWTLPAGRFQVPVTGIGEAIEAVQACEQTAASASK